MVRSGGIKPGSVSSKRAPGSRFRGLYRLLLIMAVFFVAVVFLFPVILEPGIDVPTDLQFASPSSLVVQISNQNLTPLMDLEYSCEVSKLTLANGSAVTDAKVLIRGTIRKLAGRRAISARCQTAYLVTAPLKTAEYTLTITYRAYPWHRERTSVYRIAARINGSNQVTAWKVN